MKKIVKHLIFNPLALEGVHIDCIVYACQYDDGSFIENPGTIYNLGNGAVLLFPCMSCQAEIKSQTIEPILIEAAKDVFRRESNSASYNIELDVSGLRIDDIVNARDTIRKSIEKGFRENP